MRAIFFLIFIKVNERLRVIIIYHEFQNKNQTHFSYKFSDLLTQTTLRIAYF